MNTRVTGRKQVDKRNKIKLESESGHPSSFTWMSYMEKTNASKGENELIMTGQPARVLQAE